MALAVGVNLLHLVPDETGGSELYARRLLPALLDEADPPELTLFATRETAASLRAEPWARGVRIEEIRVESRHRARRVLAEQTLLPQAARRNRVDLLHNVFTTAPALPGVPQVTTILDVIYKRYPETHPGILAWGMRALVPLAARRSRRILTLSEASKADIVRFLGLAPERVDVTYLGPGLPDDATPTPEDELRRQLNLGDEPIVLTVSAKRPHKNLERLISAVGTLEAPAKLVVPGYATPFEEDLRARAERVAPGRVVFTGWVDSQTLEGLYRAATCFVFPSLAEGFGLPVLEAMRRGLPVACSDASSLPELGGDAALYFDATQTHAIQAALERLLVDSNLRERLSAAGGKQAKKFSWSDTAARTLESYERALATARS
jgi:glycosyltransferase involved in cell wall biosynthesis